MVWAISILAAAQAATAVALLWLALRVRRLSAGRPDDADAAERAALFDRRRAAMAPLDSLHMAWARRSRPSEASLADAMAAAEEAQLLFPAELAEPLGTTCALLAECLAVRRWRAAAVCGDRYGDRDELLEREQAIEAELVAAVAALRTRLADAARLAGRG